MCFICPHGMIIFLIYCVVRREENILRSFVMCMEAFQPLSFENKQTKNETKKQQLSWKARKDFPAE